MKVKVSKLLVSLTAVFLLALTAYAQDELPLQESQDPARREFNLDEDKILIYDHSSHSSAVKDTVLQTTRVVPGHPVKASKSDSHKSGHKEEEDALSFNFIYYMLQKFKMSDLVDN
jgi:hypothetical protein